MIRPTLCTSVSVLAGLLLVVGVQPAAALDPADAAKQIPNADAAKQIPKADGAKPVPPSHNENPTIPATEFGEANSPCNGATIRPDSAGNFNFTLTAAKLGVAATAQAMATRSRITGYSLQFSKNGAIWNDPINGAMQLSGIQGPTVPVNAGKLLLVSKTWYWRVTTGVGAGKPDIPGKRVCKFAIEPSGGAQALHAPILVSPVCASHVPAGTVLFDAKPGAGTFQIFRAELQYNPAVGSALGAWHTSNLITVVDKTNAGSKFGVAVPVQTLGSQAARWRWRARLYNEKMPLFGTSTTAPWSPWCEFTVPSTAGYKKAAPGSFQQVPPAGSGTQRQSTPQR
jgi:hypothetical protein